METDMQESLEKKFCGISLQQKSYIQKKNLLNPKRMVVLDVTREQGSDGKYKTELLLGDGYNRAWLSIRGAQFNYIKENLAVCIQTGIWIKSVKNTDETWSAFISFDMKEWV